MNLLLLCFCFFSFLQLQAFAEAKTSFYFPHDPIDVVIPCVEKDLCTLDLCIDGIKKNGTNIRRVIVISKQKLTDMAEWYDEKNYPFSFEDIANALAHGDMELEHALLKKGSRTGWYYQQLLKLYAPIVIPNISTNVLILDADTIFLNPVTFLNENGAGLYNPGIEYNPPYFKHAQLLIPGFYKLFDQDSGISHHMIFQKPVLTELFELVESTHLTDFWKIFCQLVSPEDLNYSGASEYEIYFNYVFSRTNQTSIRRLNWRNIQRLREISIFKNEGLHYVSIHEFDRIND